MKCAEVTFYQPEISQHLIKATQPFLGISMDFKGPVASIAIRN